MALPGVQVLFAFLLTVPFTSASTTSASFQQKLYFGVLISVALATVLLVAPTAGHRILFRRQQKEFIVTISNSLALIGHVPAGGLDVRSDRADQRLPLRGDDRDRQHRS